MAKEQVGQTNRQIIRKDGRKCFIESLSDAFDIGKAHFVFAAYDLSKPAGARQTDNINIYIDMAEILELCRKMESGEMRQIIRSRKDKNDKTPIQQWLGGTSADRLRQYGRPREDGMSLSRVAKLICGDKADFLFVADSGPGEQDEKGLIVPRFQGKGENHVVLSLSWADLSEFLLMTKMHFMAYLAAVYMRQND